jgi:amino acid adenylation domain-containing protein
MVLDPRVEESGMTRSLVQAGQDAGAATNSSSIQSTVADLFAAQVLARPSSVALEVSDKTLTYSSLGSRVERLARYLSANGIRRDDVVALSLKRTENLVIGMLGVITAGAAYLPLNPTDPALRVAQVLAHAAPRFILTDSQSMTNLPQGSSPVCVLDGPIDDVDQEGYNPPTAPAPADLAYVIYTSGTTGTPKGVAITHGALANVLADIAERVSFTDRSSWLAVTTVSFDIAALELLLPLCYGGKVLLASEEQSRIGRVLAGIIHHKKPTVMQATPITWRILMESGWTGSRDLTILSGGDRLDRDLANQLIVRSHSLWNMYGPTETTIWSTAEKLCHGEDAVTIGRPIANTEIYLLDQDGQLQISGEIGEICIAGDGLARGYLNNPELTDHHFIDLQVDSSRSIRLYRTGDLGRWDARGRLEFHGRIDHQVKINGYRIELVEVETTIRRYPGITDVAVLGVGGPAHQKRLYAFLVGNNLEQVKGGLIDHLTRHLPKYMIPERFWAVDRLPSTPNGKRDLAVLESHSKVKAELID